MENNTTHVILAAAPVRCRSLSANGNVFLGGDAQNGGSPFGLRSKTQRRGPSKRGTPHPGRFSRPAGPLR